MSEHGRAVPGSLFKTTIMIWSEFPGEVVELERLAHEATSGEAYCSRYRSEQLADPSGDPPGMAPSSSSWGWPDGPASDGARCRRRVLRGDRDGGQGERSRGASGLCPLALRRHPVRTGLEPADLAEAVLEGLVLSNENPSPADYGIEIIDAEATEVSLAEPAAMRSAARGVAAGRTRKGAGTD